MFGHAKIALVCLSIAGTAFGDSTSTVAGTAEYKGTAVQTNPNGIPTLVYNCAKLPAICKNVNNRNPISGGGASSPGTLTLQGGVDYIELNADTDQARHDSRNGAACPDRWKRTHACPERDQPVTVPRGASVGSGSFVGRKYNNVPQGDDGSNMIADAQSNYRGMIWTCDEWPPAMYDMICPYTKTMLILHQHIGRRSWRRDVLCSSKSRLFKYSTWSCGRHCSSRLGTEFPVEGTWSCETMGSCCRG